MASDPTNPRVLAERWELSERIGSGAMGEVWKGRHVVLGHDVAVKLMKRDASRDQSLVARFVREARIAAQLRHRNLARVEDFGTTPEGRPFLVMELLRGDSLEALLERGGRLDACTVALVARHVGAACDLAHPAGVIHRDLKPANCFLVRDEDGAALVKVLDFGVAKVSDGLVNTVAGIDPALGFALIGTPVYMSPEQVKGAADIDGRSDLWSLAVMLYELLTGNIPYDADALPSLLCAITEGNVVPPTKRDPSLAPSLDEWMRKGLSLDRDARFQTGRELADALDLALGSPRGARETRAPLPATVPEFAAITLHPSAQDPAISHGSLAPTQDLPALPQGFALPTAPMPMMLLGSQAPFAPPPVPQRGTFTPVVLVQRPSKSPGALIAAGIAAVIVLGVVAVVALQGDDPSPNAAPVGPRHVPRSVTSPRPVVQGVRTPPTSVLAAPTRSIPTSPIPPSPAGVIARPPATAVAPPPSVPVVRTRRPTTAPSDYPTNSPPMHPSPPPPSAPPHSGTSNPAEP